MHGEPTRHDPDSIAITSDNGGGAPCVRDADVDLLIAFLNTVDVEDGSDELASTDGLHDWIVRLGLDPGAAAPPPAPPTADELAFARELRDALRATARSHHEPTSDPAVTADLDALASRLPVRVAFGPAGVGVAAAGDGTCRALARVIVATYALSRRGAWQRVKICPDDTCQWAFFDTSRNRSRRWCSMEVCGNRNKVRAYRERHVSGVAGEKDERPGA